MKYYIYIHKLTILFFLSCILIISIFLCEHPFYETVFQVKEVYHTDLWQQAYELNYPINYVSVIDADNPKTLKSGHGIILDHEFIFTDNKQVKISLVLEKPYVKQLIAIGILRNDMYHEDLFYENVSLINTITFTPTESGTYKFYILNPSPNSFVIKSFNSSDS